MGEQQKREHDGHPIITVPSPYWEVRGLTSSGWMALYHAEDKSAGRRLLRQVWDTDSSPAHDRYEDFYLAEPELKHELPRGMKGQALTWYESNSPVTADKRRRELDRRTAEQPRLPRTRGRAGVTRK